MNNAERMARANIDPETLKDMERACPTSVMRDIAMRDCRAPLGPSSQGIVPTSQQLSHVSSGAGLVGSTTGWQPVRKFGDDGRHPTPGVDLLDRQLAPHDHLNPAEHLQREEAVRRARLGR
jgi:hypothetical protein